MVQNSYSMHSIAQMSSSQAQRTGVDVDIDADIKDSVMAMVVMNDDVPVYI